LPLTHVATTFARLGAKLSVEFVPKEDPQLRRMLASRRDVFADYSLDGLKAGFGERYRLVSEQPVPGTQRTLMGFESARRDPRPRLGPPMTLQGAECRSPCA
jgi:hypothetical protein